MGDIVIEIGAEAGNGQRNGGGNGGPALSPLAALAARPFDTLDDVIDAALRLMSDWIGVRLSMIHRLEGDNIVVSHMHDRIGLGIRPPVTIPRTATFCDTVLSTLTPLVVLDADAEPWRNLLGKQIVGTKTYIGVPILLNDSRLFGTLCAHDRRALDLGEHEIDLMLVLARLVASHIERDEAARIEADSARRLALRNAELSEAVQQLSVLQEITESIAAQLDLKSLLETVVGSAVQLLGAHAGAISLIGESLDAPRRLTATYNLPQRVQTDELPARAGNVAEGEGVRATA